MGLQQEDLWEIFRSTGSIKAYLEFCAKRKENAKKNVNTDERNCN